MFFCSSGGEVPSDTPPAPAAPEEPETNQQPFRPTFGARTRPTLTKPETIPETKQDGDKSRLKNFVKSSVLQRLKVPNLPAGRQNPTPAEPFGGDLNVDEEKSKTKFVGLRRLNFPSGRNQGEGRRIINLKPITPGIFKVSTILSIKKYFNSITKFHPIFHEIDRYLILILI